MDQCLNGVEAGVEVFGIEIQFPEFAHLCQIGVFQILVREDALEQGPVVIAAIEFHIELRHVPWYAHGIASECLIAVPLDPLPAPEGGVLVEVVIACGEGVTVQVGEQVVQRC